MLRQNSHTARPSTCFPLGETYITPGAKEALDIAGETAIQYLHRHISVTGANLSEDDVKETN